ncbi:MAG: DinB family protein [Mycobacterium leprae]
MHPQVEAILVRARSVRRLILAEIEAATAEELTYRPGDRWSARDTLVHLGNCEETGTGMLRHFILGEPHPFMVKEPLPPDEWNRRELARCEHLDVAGGIAYVHSTRQALEAVAAQAAGENLDQVVRELGMIFTHESGHLHQIREAVARARGDAVLGELHGLAYARHQVLELLNLERWPAAALEWRSAPEKWSVKETLLHLATWDRFATGVYAAVAEDRPLPPMPFADGELDRWNREQVEALSWLSCAQTFHECGAAWGVMTAQLQRIKPAQWESPQAREWHGYRGHDLHHVESMRQTLFAWRQTQ